MVDTLTRQLATFIAESAPSAAVIDKAMQPFADTLGAMLSGVSSEVAAPLNRYLEHAGSGQSLILGSSRTAPVEAAALVNGTFGHALDYDDGIALAPVHPSSAVIAALLTEAAGRSGQDVLNAYVIGVEVSVRLAMAIGMTHYNHGWHATGTVGIMGAVAALARVRGLRVEQILMALGLAVSMASGMRSNFGTMAKPLHAGWAARSAVAAVALASSGLTARTDILEAEKGYFSVYGLGKSKPEQALNLLGQPYVIDVPGLSLKRYACCYASHRPIEGIRALRRELGFTAADIDNVRCLLAPGSLGALIYPRPKTGLEGKFSLEYALAAAMLDDVFSLWTFSDEAVMRPEAQALLPKIDAREDPKCALDDPQAEHKGYSRRGYVEVCVKLKDGRTATRRIDVVPGSPEDGLEWDDIRTKFLDCAKAASVPHRQAVDAIQTLMSLERCQDMSMLLSLLRPPGDVQCCLNGGSGWYGCLGIRTFHEPLVG